MVRVFKSRLFVAVVAATLFRPFDGLPHLKHVIRSSAGVASGRRRRPPREECPYAPRG